MIATTGFFDGVHLGHRLVIERLVSEAHARGDESLVVTFWPHPRAVLQDGARELRLLTTLEEKKALLKGLGVDRIEVLDFTRRFASLTAEQLSVMCFDVTFPKAGWYTIIIRNQERTREYTTFFVSSVS